MMLEEAVEEGFSFVWFTLYFDCVSLLFVAGWFLVTVVLFLIGICLFNPLARTAAWTMMAYDRANYNK